jgi:hypothetical protein
LYLGGGGKKMKKHNCNQMVLVEEENVDYYQIFIRELPIFLVISCFGLLYITILTAKIHPELTYLIYANFELVLIILLIFTVFTVKPKPKYKAGKIITICPKCKQKIIGKDLDDTPIHEYDSEYCGEGI